MNNTVSNNFNIIAEKLDKLRRDWSWFILAKGMLRVLTLISVIVFILIICEGFRYFNTSIRRDIYFFTIGFSGIFLLTPIILALMVRFNRMASYSNHRLSILIGEEYPDIGDRLVNVLQLHEMAVKKEAGYSLELVNHSIRTIADRVQSYSFGVLVPWRKFKVYLLRYVAIFLVIIFLCIYNFSFFRQSFIRLTHPEVEFSIPKPFTIVSTTGSFGVFGGDSVDVAFHCEGDYPDEIQFDAAYPDFIKNGTGIVDDSGNVIVHFGPVRNTIYYEAFVQNRSVFKPWKRISSGVDTIFVTDRPEILHVKTRIEFPAYTRLDPKIQESNTSELTIYPGSDLYLNLLSNKMLKTASIRFKSGKTTNLTISGKTAAGKFIIHDNDEFQITVSDDNDVTNINPINYRIRLIPDAYPVCQLISPDMDIELTESMEIPLGIRISDDFGFQKALIQYRLIKRYDPDRQTEESIEFPLPDKQLTLQELYYVWNVGELNLSPEDIVEYKVSVYDNDPINGPKAATSRILRARFPSLNDLFADVNEQRDQIAGEGEEILNNLESSKEILEEISRELLKDPKLNWEQKNQLEKEIQKTKEAGEKLAKMADQLDEIIQKSRDNQLFDEETISKFAKLQDAFRDVMTPELREAMNKLQQALEKMDSSEIKKALDQFRTNRDQFAKELDRMIKLLQRVKIEQSVGEIVRRFEDMVKRQENINSELDKTSESNEPKFDQLAGEEKSVVRDSEIALDLMERTRDEMSDFPLMPSEQLESLIQEMKKSGLMDELKQAQKSLSKANKQQAQQSTRSAQQQLHDFLNKMMQFQSEFNKRTMDEVMSDFRNVIFKTMQLSQDQEKLSQVIKHTPRQSERLLDVAVNQQQLQRNLIKIIDELIALSNKTFGLSPRVGKGFGQASAAMNDAVRQMEERSPASATKSAQQATAAINQSALELINSMNSLQSSGSASGFENYLQQLQKMAGQQQGINDETQMISLGQAGQQAALQRLAARQQQLRNSLEQLQNEISESTKQSGDLSGIAKDMDDVIKDLQENRVLRKTLERQQRILSRLLDAQKSLRTQDFKRERKSKTGEELVRESPDQLPADLGERRSLLQENLEKALKEGYTREYEEIIRQYFELLSKESDRK